MNFDSTMQSIGLPLFLTLCGMVLGISLRRKLAAMGFIIASVSLLAYNIGIGSLNAACAFSVLSSVLVAADVWLGQVRIGQGKKIRDSQYRRAFIDQMWSDNNPSPEVQFTTWLAREHGLNEAEILYPFRSSDGRNVYYTWRSKRGKGDITLPADMSGVHGPWLTRTRDQWVKDCQAWEAFKIENGDNLDLLETHARNSRKK